MLTNFTLVAPYIFNKLGHQVFFWKCFLSANGGHFVRGRMC